jgi:hypothetical protein
MCKPVALPPEFKKRPLERLIREVEAIKAKKKGWEDLNPRPYWFLVLILEAKQAYFGYSYPVGFA